MAKKTQLKVVPQELKLDFGCGPRKAEGFIGVDQHKMEGVDVILDIGKERWPWADDSVSEARASHFVEHLAVTERVHFFNELYRVLGKGGTCAIVTPYAFSERAYGDPTHKWPPVVGWTYFYLNKEWRLREAPHTDKKWNPEGYDCDFDWAYGHGMHAELLKRSTDFQQFAIQWFKEAIQDLHCTITARK